MYWCKILEVGLFLFLRIESIRCFGLIFLFFNILVFRKVIFSIFLVCLFKGRLFILRLVFLEVGMWWIFFIMVLCNLLGFIFKDFSICSVILLLLVSRLSNKCLVLIKLCFRWIVLLWLWEMICLIWGENLWLLFIIFVNVFF